MPFILREATPRVLGWTNSERTGSGARVHPLSHCLRTSMRTSAQEHIASVSHTQACTLLARARGRVCGDHGPRRIPPRGVPRLRRAGCRGPRRGAPRGWRQPAPRAGAARRLGCRGCSRCAQALHFRTSPPPRAARATSGARAAAARARATCGVWRARARRFPSTACAPSRGRWSRASPAPRTWHLPARSACAAGRHAVRRGALAAWRGRSAQSVRSSWQRLFGARAGAQRGKGALRPPTSRAHSFRVALRGALPAVRRHARRSRASSLSDTLFEVCRQRCQLHGPAPGLRGWGH